MARTQTFQQTVVIHDCCTCGGPIAMTRAQETVFERQHGTFRCVTGHENFWPAKSDKDRLVEAQDKLATTETTVKTLRLEKSQMADELRKCPCPVTDCGKRVKDLAAHQRRVHGKS